MWEEVLKISGVYFSSMFKFFFGPITGYASGLNLFTTILATVAGSMTTVLLLTFFGDWIREKILNRFTKKKKKFSSRNRKVITFWRKYGLIGVAVLMPMVFTPPGATLLAVSFGTPKDKLIFSMFLSSAFWAVVISVVIYFFGGPKALPEVVL